MSHWSIEDSVFILLLFLGYSRTKFKDHDFSPFMPISFYPPDISLSDLLENLNLPDIGALSDAQFAVVQEELGVAEYLLTDMCNADVSPFRGLGSFLSGIKCAKSICDNDLRSIQACNREFLL